MSKKDINIVLLQSDIFWEDITKNLAHFSGMIKKITTPTDLIVLPEMFNTGFTTNTRKCSEFMNGPSMEFLREAAVTLGCTVVGSLLIGEEDGFYNRLVCMFPDGKYQACDKRHLFRLSEEHKVMRSGDRKIIVRCGDWNFLPLVCYDLRFPVWSKNTYRNGKHEYDFLVYPSNWPQTRSYVWKSLLVARAIENQAYVIGVNRTGTDGYGIRYAGNSLVVDPKGTLVAEAGDKEEILQATLSLEELNLYRESYKIALDWDRFNIET
ncbi:MAG: nitrilase family protein [Bacteroidetes bacterium]|nr:nitrilase family protein [Bacteroidota bacterium]